LFFADNYVATGRFEGAAPEEDVEGAFFLLEEVAEVFLKVGGDFVQGGERRRYASSRWLEG
jgi:hypothetical protein